MALTPEKKRIAIEMRAKRVGWMAISAITGVSRHFLQAELEPGYLEKSRAAAVAAGAKYRKRIKDDRSIAERRRDRQRTQRQALGSVNHIVTTDSVKIPAEVLFDRDRRYALAPRSLTAAQFGDPLPGYSELDKRRS